MNSGVASHIVQPDLEFSYCSSTNRVTLKSQRASTWTIPETLDTCSVLTHFESWLTIISLSSKSLMINNHLHLSEIHAQVTRVQKFTSCWICECVADFKLVGSEAANGQTSCVQRKSSEPTANVQLLTRTYFVSLSDLLGHFFNHLESKSIKMCLTPNPTSNGDKWWNISSMSPPCFV